MIEYNLHHVNGLYFELTSDGGKNLEYDVTFEDLDRNEIVYKTKLKPKSWARLSRKYLSNIRIHVRLDEKQVKRIDFFEHMVGKRVFINFESKALGDTIAWIPYCEEFRKKYQCRVVVSTFHNHLFERVYPTLKFVERGVVVHDIVGMFDIGWFFDKEKEPNSPQTIPLQATATEILHLAYKEVRPTLDFTPSQRPIDRPYVCISTLSTANLKYWHYWQDVIDFLVGNGLKVYEISKDETHYKNVEPIDDKSIRNVMNLLHHCDFYMGLSSGLSWLAWAMKKKVYMIANFSLKDHEFQSNCIRITDESICHGCWNNPLFKFNRGDANWCPEHEDTPKIFECHKSISADRVILELVNNQGLVHVN
jgi:autotransporter strand-loop-strand O-heptosyltransferase